MPILSTVARRKFLERATDNARLTTRLRRAATDKTGMTSTGFVLVGVGIAAWCLGRYIGGRPLYLLAYGVVGVIIYAKFATRSRPAVSGDRTDHSPRVTEGAEIAIDVTLRSAKRISNVVLEEKLPSLFGQNAVLPVATVSPGDEGVSCSYSFTAWRRGVYELGPLTVHWGDPFGLTRRSAEIGESFPLIVHPNIEPVTDRALTRMWEDPPFRPPVSKPWPTGLELYGMRQYAHGDDVRRINWRGYMRTGELLVQEAEQGISDKVVMLLDANVRYHSKGLISESFEEAIRAVASLGIHHLSEGYEVTVEGNDGRITGPLRSGPSKIRLLDELARLDLGKAPLTEGMTRLLTGMSRDTHLLIVTPYLDLESAARLELLAQRGVRAIVVALVWDEDHTENLTRATAFGAQIVEIRPNTPLSVAFRREVVTAARF
jgi:uncharacterized protein (DUF58 family)